MAPHRLRTQAPTCSDDFASPTRCRLIGNRICPSAGLVIEPAARWRMSWLIEGRSAGHAAVAPSRRSKASFASRSTAVASWLPRRHAAW